MSAMGNKQSGGVPLCFYFYPVSHAICNVRTNMHSSVSVETNRWTCFPKRAFILFRKMQNTTNLAKCGNLKTEKKSILLCDYLKLHSSRQLPSNIFFHSWASSSFFFCFCCVLFSDVLFVNMGAFTRLVNARLHPSFLTTVFALCGRNTRLFLD